MATPTLVVDTTGLKKLAQALRLAAPEIATQMRREIRAAGALVVVEARSRASWSDRIPNTIRVRTLGGGATVKVVAGIGESAPHIGEAKALENAGNPGSFRHPVFGNKSVYVNQEARPFLHPALTAKAEEVAQAIGDAIDTAMDSAFRGADL